MPNIQQIVNMGCCIYEYITIPNPQPVSNVFKRRLFIFWVNLMYDGYSNIEIL